MGSRSAKQTRPSFNMRDQYAIVLFLVVMCLVAFGQVWNFEFIDFDDGEYVFANKHVQAGLTGEVIQWAFSTGYFANWHPLTWLSHMLDCQLFALNAGAHHITNLLFHITNSLLLFLLLQRLTKATWRSAFVAALFAIHPRLFAWSRA